MPTHANTRDPQVRIAEADDVLEQHMGELGLSIGTRQFLRKLHVVEKRLNDAFEMAHQGGDLEAQVSHVYHELYRAG